MLALAKLFSWLALSIYQAVWTVACLQASHIGKVEAPHIPSGCAVCSMALCWLVAASAPRWAWPLCLG